MHKGNKRVVKLMMFVSDMMSYKLPRGRWYDCSNLHVVTEEKNDDARYTFCQETEHAFHQILSTTLRV
jgi:hypothetical protein